MVWEDKHIDALKELHGKDGNLKELIEWQAKHGPKDLGKFLSRIDTAPDNNEVDARLDKIEEALKRHGIRN